MRSLLLVLVMLSAPLAAVADPAFMLDPTLQGFAKKKSARLFVDDGTGVAWTYFTGTAIADAKGNAYVQNGTVPQVAKNGLVPPGAGPYSASNFYSIATPNWSQFAAGYMVCMAWVQSVAPGNDVLLNSGSTSAANVFQTATGGRVQFYPNGVTAVSPVNTTATGSANAACFGMSAATGTASAKLNRGSTVTSAGITFTSGTLRLGLYFNGTAPAVNEIILEVYATTTPYSDAAATAQLNHALTAMGL